MNLFDRLFKRFGANKTTQAPSPEAARGLLQTAGGAPDLEGARHAAAQATHARLDTYWNSIGTVEPDVLTHLVSPGLSGGPHWPTTRQAYRVIRREGSIILATDGMSDPYDDGECTSNGFGMELFLETADIAAPLRGGMGDVGPLGQSWAFELLKHVADLVAEAGGIVDKLDIYGVLSVEFPGVGQSRTLAAQIPRHFVSADDSLGILLGGPAQDFPGQLDDMPLSPVRIVPIVLLTAAELDHIRSGGRSGREDVVGRLAASPSRHRCDLQRQSSY